MKKILFLANHFITLFSFRKELINRLVNDGNEVYLSLPRSAENRYFEEIGCKIIPTPIDRRGVNPLKDVKLLLFYKKTMSQINPDIIFSYTIKPNIYGAIASNITKHKQVCNVTGTGATFLKRTFVSDICKLLYRLSFRSCYQVFFQNAGDRDFFIRNNLVKNNDALLPGSGCNLVDFPYSDMPDDSITKFIFIGRIMKLKGIDEYLECAREIKTRYANVEFYIAGWNEEEHYIEVVEEYQRLGHVEQLGFRKDIADWIKKCHCTVLPSHGGEGVPNVLLESAAMGRVCIGSRVSGTTDAIDDGVTGYLFETGNTSDLINKVEKFLNLDPSERVQMGRNGRARVEQRFDREIIIKKYLDEVERA